MASVHRLENSSNSHVKEVKVGECVTELKSNGPDFNLEMESLEANILLASEMIKLWFFCQCVLYWLAYRRRLVPSRAMSLSF